ncbi:MAG: alanine/ornithine racemase family PLP-dependent enzyme [Defluviitaleaceae bacterium]|nr:alanine/ornithine racemase family PLP-dependent enzyme [Defluviitaleaceae bacterium]MCL2240453.1 alanine/ornithine racemase family PLP-dependent enzyme [Defluviitaleaceae bacterium]
MYPRLNIDLSKFEHNAQALLELCHSRGISVAAVTKVYCADTKMVEILCRVGVDFLADSRLENIESYPQSRKCRTMLLRLPSPSEAERVVRGCDISCNSELHTLKRLAEAARKLDVRHGVILMVDLGDLREGIYYDNKPLLYETADFIHSQPCLSLAGIGVNLTCYGSILPTAGNLRQLCGIRQDLSQRLGVEIPILSGGNSSSLYLVENGEIPAGINNLRLGEAMVRGIETAFTLPFAGLETDVVTLEAEIIEIMEKPSLPEGEKGYDAFGQQPHYEDKGPMRRAILAVGRQDTSYEGLASTLPGVDIIGASSDHLMVDVTRTAKPLQVGDTLTFSLSYGAILAGFTSKYVQRSYIGTHQR